ncbi:MAG: protein kinase [Rhodanobacteraceae bacterium]|nr:protein kinase [Rhodanobacteraceae bacterium]
MSDRSGVLGTSQVTEPQWRKLRPLLDHALDLEGDERVDYLAEVNQNHPELGAALARMLGRASNNHLLDRPLHELADGLPLVAQASPLNDRAASLVGSQLGPYRLLDLLGRGGMGAVFKAERRHQGYVHQVALKLMAETGPQLRERFLREQKILSALRHPNIAQLIDAGESDRGEPYLVLEYVAGESILDAAKRQHAPLQLRLQWLITVSEALAHAHRHLVVHRDLKPSNVMLDNDGHVKLLDFGIAKLIAGEIGPELTQADIGPMTPEYAAPEQFRGDPVTVATDLYQLGVLTYVLLSERLPYGGSASARLAWAQAVCETDPAPLNTREMAHLSVPGGMRRVRRLRGDLNSVLQKAMAKRPEDRYSSADAFADELRALLDGRALAAKGNSNWYRFERLVNRHRTLSATIVVALLGLLAISAVAIQQAHVARAAASSEQTQRLRAEEAAAHSEITRNFIGNRLREAQASKNPDGSRLTMRDWVINLLPSIDADLAEAPQEQIELGMMFAQLLTELDEHDRAIDLLDVAIQRARAVENHGHALIEGLTMRGQVLARMARIEESQANLSEALNLAEQSIAAEAPEPPTETERRDLIVVRTTMLINANAQGHLREALAIGQHNLADRIAIYGADSPQLAVDYNNIGSTLIGLGRYLEAKPNIERAGELLAASPGGGAARMAYIHGSLAVIAIGVDDLDEARRQVDAAIEICIRQLGENATETKIWQRFVAQIHFLRGETSAANEILEGVISAMTTPKHRKLSAALLQRAQVQLVEHRNDAVLATCDQARALFAAEHSQSQPAKRFALVCALAATRSGQMQADLVALREQVNQMYVDKDIAPNHRAEAAIYFAAILQHQKLEDEAQRWFMLAVEQLSLNMPSDRAIARTLSHVPDFKRRD